LAAVVVVGGAVSVAMAFTPKPFTRPVRVTAEATSK